MSQKMILFITTAVRSSNYVFMHQAIKSLFFTSAIHGGEWSVSRPGRLDLEEKTRIHIA
jgi:hypothetical protein